MFRFGPATLPTVPGSIRLINPADESLVRDLPLAGVTRPTRQSPGACRRRRVEGGAPSRPRPSAAPIRRHDRRPTPTSSAQLETTNMGMPIGSSTWCANAAADVVHYFAGAIDKHTGSTIPVAGGVDMTFHEPLGVVGLITPWNFPVLMASWKIGPALAAGNTAVMKPAEITPLTTMRLGELALEAGIPEGVLNVVVGTGTEVGWRFVEHPDVRKVAFTGSTVGRQADHGWVRRTGEAGHAGARRQERQHRLRRRRPRAGRRSGARWSVRQLRTGLLRSQPGAGATRTCSTVSWSCSSPPLGNGRWATRWMRRRRWARSSRRSTSPRLRSFSDGLDTVFTGEAPSTPGYWHPIMIATPSDPTATVCRDEIFGPVAVVLPFDDEADAIRICNDSDYGLSGSVWTRDGAKAIRVARAMEAGRSASTRTARFATALRSAASSKVVSAASTRCTCSTTTPS